MNKRIKKKHRMGTRRKRRKIILCALRGNPAPKWFLKLDVRQLVRYMCLEGRTIDFRIRPMEKLQ